MLIINMKCNNKYHKCFRFNLIMNYKNTLRII